MSSILEMSRGPLLTEDQAGEILAQGEEAVIFVLLTLAKQLAQPSVTAAGSSHPTPATPAGMKPVWCRCGTVWPNCLIRDTKKLAGQPASRRGFTIVF